MRMPVEPLGITDRFPLLITRLLLLNIAPVFWTEHQHHGCDPEEEDDGLGCEAEDSNFCRGGVEGVAFQVRGYQRVQR